MKTETVQLIVYSKIVRIKIITWLKQWEHRTYGFLVAILTRHKLQPNTREIMRKYFLSVCHISLVCLKNTGCLLIETKKTRTWKNDLDLRFSHILTYHILLRQIDTGPHAKNQLKQNTMCTQFLAYLHFLNNGKENLI